MKQTLTIIIFLINGIQVFSQTGTTTLQNPTFNGPLQIGNNNVQINDNSPRFTESDKKELLRRITELEQQTKVKIRCFVMNIINGSNGSEVLWEMEKFLKENGYSEIAPGHRGQIAGRLFEGYNVTLNGNCVEIAMGMLSKPKQNENKSIR